MNSCQLSLACTSRTGQQTVADDEHAVDDCAGAELERNLAGVAARRNSDAAVAVPQTLLEAAAAVVVGNNNFPFVHLGRCTSGLRSWQKDWLQLLELRSLIGVVAFPSRRRRRRP